MRTSKTSGTGTGLANILAITVCSAFLVTTAGFAKRVVSLAEAHGTTTTTERPVKDWRPDITHCNDAPDLWECITHRRST